MFNYLPIAIPHDLVSERGPVHPAPHSLPEMQVRLRVCVPIPHLTEHALHAPKALILEFTERKEIISEFLTIRIRLKEDLNFGQMGVVYKLLCIAEVNKIVQISID